MKYLIAVVFLLTISISKSQEIAKRINEYTNTYVKSGDFSGCILISKNEKILYENCFGNASHSLNVKNELNTKFKIGSISKQFTATAILILEEEGLLQTSDTLSKFFPNESKVDQITIEQLLNHTSGITDIYSVANFNKISCEKKSISDLSKLILQSDLEFKPGEQYQYSNGGYALLAQIIEQVTKTSYGDYLSKVIFEPLKMTNTGHNLGTEVIQNLAIGYDPLGYNDVKITDYLDPELLKGSGSLYSTNNDLLKWINSIKNKSLLTEASYEKLLKNYGHNYGFGISVYRSFDKNVFGHDGRVNGYIADYLHYLAEDISIIILGNIQTGVSDFFRKDIAAIVFNEKYESSANTILPSSQNSIDPKKLLGTYAFGPNFKVYVQLLEGRLQVRANEGGYSELVLLQDGRYFNRTLYAYIEFLKNENGKVWKMNWTNNNENSFEGLKE